MFDAAIEKAFATTVAGIALVALFVTCHAILSI
jgi:hypothetical protein